MKRIHLLRMAEGGEAAGTLAPLYAAVRAAGLRAGWLDLAGAAAPVGEAEGLEPAAAAGAFRAVAVGGGRVVSIKATVGPPVLADLLREHFLGCVLVVIHGPEDAAAGPDLTGIPRLEAAGERWRVIPPGAAARELAAAELAARLRRPRPWD